MQLSPLEQERFGVRTARAPRLTRDTVAEALRFCALQRVDLLIARCDTADLASVHCLERCGFELMDTLVYYRRTVGEIASGAAVQVQPVEPGEAPLIKALARDCFAGYGGHYHADSRLPREACDQVYPSWAWRACTDPAVADVVLMAPGESGPVGFVSLRRVSPEEVDVGLLGVATVARRQGIGAALLRQAAVWARQHGASRLAISTQVTNVASQRLWTKLDFALSESFYTFHKWFN